MLRKQIWLALIMVVGLSCFILTSNTVSALNDCGNGVKTSVLPCSKISDGEDKIENTPLFTFLVLVINILTAGVGIVAVGGVVYGAILYTSAGNSPDQTKKAIEIIRNVVFGIVAYAFMYSFLNFIIPGGLI